MLLVSEAYWIRCERAPERKPGSFEFASRSKWRAMAGSAFLSKVELARSTGRNQGPACAEVVREDGCRASLPYQRSGIFGKVISRTARSSHSSSPTVLFHLRQTCCGSSAGAFHTKLEPRGRRKYD